MRYIAAAIHMAIETITAVCLVVLFILALPFIGLYRLVRWAELQVVYGGDRKARDKDEWRGE